MSHAYEFLREPAFHDYLLAIDREQAEKVRQAGCPKCGGALHAANYARAPRGGLERRAIRLSFCCARDGCRARQTPGSVRFLGRKVFLGVIVLLASAVYRRLTPEQRDRLETRLGVSERTLVRWRRWWRLDFARCRFWKAMGSFFGTPVDSHELPVSLLERFDGDERAQGLSALCFLMPIAGGKGLTVQAF